MGRTIRPVGRSIEVNGRTVGGGTAIPDSAIHRWPMGEGSGTTFADSIGAADYAASASGFWTSGTWVNDFATSYDGSDDNASASVGIDSLTDITILLSVRVETLNQGDSILWSWTDDGFGLFQLGYNRNGNNRFQFDVGDGSQTVQAESTTAVPDTTTKYRLAGVYDENNQIELHVNATQESSLSIGTKGPQSPTTKLGSQYDDSMYSHVTLDNPIICDSVLTGGEITDDYNNQPWS